MIGAHVVLQEDDDTGEDGVSVGRVFVNGVDVGLMTAAPKVRVGIKGTRTEVVLTLAASKLEIRGELADGERRESRAGFTARVD